MNQTMKKLLFPLVAILALGAFAGVPYRLGVAGYTYHQQSLEQMLEAMRKLDVHYLCVKDFHLPYTATDEQIAAFKEKCAAYGVEPYALGPLYTKSVSQLRPYFDFARRMGLKTVVGVPYEPGDGKDSWNKRKPSMAQLEEIDRLVKEYDIRYAIHNHGPASPTMYPSVGFGYELIKDMDERVGFCLDVGWEYGCDIDPNETIRRHANRIHDVHIKNFAKDRPNGHSVPWDRGKIDLARVFQTLADVGYAGACSIEYETDFKNNFAPIAECVGYYRGVTEMIKPVVTMMPAPAGANTLSDAEKAEGWQLLWDGKTSAGWVSAKNTAAFPAKGWTMEHGVLTMKPVRGIGADRTWIDLPPEDAKLGGGGDIVTVGKYKDFMFKFDFRLTKAANSGVKYFFDETQNGGSCEEYQILENFHPDSDKGVDGNRKSASLYDIYSAHADDVLKPAGQWNTGMIVAKGAAVEHWLNGRKVLSYERGTPEFKAAVKASKYATWGKTADGKPQDWGEVAEGRILLQDHSDSTVGFCNLKIKEL